MGILLKEITLINNDWKDCLNKEIYKPYFLSLDEKVTTLYQTKTCYPKPSDIFKAFKLCSIDDVKVVIVGQDPYANKNEACGLAFSLPKDHKLTPSLRNIYKSLSDINIYNTSPDLSNWAKQGVLLLNRILTVSEKQPLSHKNINWQEFTNNIISYLNSLAKPIIFVLWGNEAIKLSKFITNTDKEIICAPHPSPLSCYNGFFEAHTFIKIKEFIKKYQLKDIDFSTDEKGNKNEKNN